MKTNYLLHKGSPVLDHEGEQIRNGGWKAPINETQFKTAISKLHKYRGHKTEFLVACTQCIALEEQSEHSVGCRSHRYSPRVAKQGNATLSIVVEEYMAELGMETSDYVAQGSHPMNPWQLRQLVYALFSGNKPCEFMLAVMVLLASNLFLREDEVSNLRFEDVDVDRSHMAADGEVG